MNYLGQLNIKALNNFDQNLHSGFFHQVVGVANKSNQASFLDLLQIVAYLLSSELHIVDDQFVNSFFYSG